MPAVRRAVTMGNAAGALKDRRDDVYETPPEAVEALLRAETLPRRLWEPCCGSGRIVNVLRAHGHQVTGSDLRGDRIDFLMEWRAPDGVEAIVTNPPFKLAADFVRHGLTLVPMVAMLLRLNFLESAERTDIIDGGRLARVLVFADRLPKMHRANWTGARSTNATAFAWFIWCDDHRGPATLGRVWCRPPARRGAK